MICALGLEFHKLSNADQIFGFILSFILEKMKEIHC